MNAFDNLSAVDDNLDGLFSKIKKSVKKVGSLHRKIKKKIVPKKILKIDKKIRHNKAVQGAAMAVAMVYAGPVVAAAMGKTAAAGAISGKMVATAALKGAAKAGISKIAGKVVTKVVQKKMVKKVNAAQAKNLANLKVAQTAAFNKAAANAKAVAQQPQLKSVVSTMQASGATPQQIAAQWKQSDAYKNIALQNTAQAIYPQIYAQLIAQGVPAATAKDLATKNALEMAKEATDKAAGGNMLAKMWPLAIPVAFALIGG